MNYGYYEYNNKRFYDRASAFDEMLIDENYYASIQFRFGENTFQKINWEQEVTTSIDFLYRERAQFLRDKYKYLILSFSGGSDSTQILQTFLKHKIFIDEIQIVHHSKAIQNLDEATVSSDRDLKQFLEYQYAAKPMLDIVRKVSPKTKITDLDVSDFTNEQLSGKKFSFLGNDRKLSPSHPKLYSNIPRTTIYYMNYYNIFIRDPKDQTCIIRGFEKPILYMSNDNLCFSFSDMIMHSVKSRIDGEIPDNFYIEDFFWSEDCPLIPVKQSQIIKRALEIDNKFYKKFILCGKAIREFDSNFKGGYSPGIMIERSYSNLIYPDWNPYTFAALKPTTIIPEFKLIESVTGDKHQAMDFISEYGKGLENKYRLIKNKGQFRKILFTKSYSLGKLKTQWEPV
jgi:hypothetical protein